MNAASLWQATTYSGQRWSYWWVWLIIAVIFLVVLIAFRGGPRRPPVR